MKLKVLSLICFLLFSAKVFSQNESISLNIKNSSVREVFNTIQQKSGYRFFYSDDLIDLNKQISVNVNNTTIDGIVKELEGLLALKFRMKKSIKIGPY